jgi:two-component system response regulator ResD
MQKAAADFIRLPRLSASDLSRKSQYLHIDTLKYSIIIKRFSHREEKQMYNILVVDDEEKIRELIKKYAVFEGYTVVEAGDGMDAVALCRSRPNDFDIIVMDIMMPELDGFSAVKELRRYTATPVLMLSARGEEYDKIRGFELGIDDYVVKPFSPKELMLRIHAIVKRSKAATDETVKDIQRFEGLTIDFTGRIVAVDGEKIDLSPKEYDLLFYLAKNKNIALTREKLITNVWGYDFYGDDRTLDTHVKLLRKSLKEYSKFIVTLRGVGYRFEVERTV